MFKALSKIFVNCAFRRPKFAPNSDLIRFRIVKERPTTRGGAPLIAPPPPPPAKNVEWVSKNIPHTKSLYKLMPSQMLIQLSSYECRALTVLSKTSISIFGKILMMKILVFIESYKMIISDQEKSLIILW